MMSGRIHHAWVFHGPSGVGKCTAAMAFAAELLTPPGRSAEAEQVRGLLAAGRHPDLHIIRRDLATISRKDTVRRQKQSNIAKEVVEEFLLEPAALAARMSSGSPVGKVFIVDEADYLDKATQDSMLKTLEEPHPGTVIILVTSDENALLPTVRSRCQRVAFFPLDARAMETWVKAGGVETRGPELQWLMQFAAGSPGTLRMAARAGLFEWQKVIEPMLQAIDRAGNSPALGATMAKLVDERAAADVKANPKASKDAANRHWAGVMLTLLVERYRRRLAAGADVGATASLRALDLILEAESQINSNVNYAPALDNLAAQLHESMAAAAGSAFQAQR